MFPSLPFLPLQASAAWLPAIFKCSKPSANPTKDPTTTTAAVPVPSTSQPANAAAAAATTVVHEPPSPVCSDEVDKASCNDKAGCVWCEKGIMGMCFSQVRPLLLLLLLPADQPGLWQRNCEQMLATHHASCYNGDYQVQVMYSWQACVQ
jgi:hypothetical protein